MPWSPPTSSGDVVAIHAALVPTANGDGEIILFGGDNHDFAASEANDFDHAARFNCRTQTLIAAHLPNFDLFCCGHAFLGDGRLLVAGGTAEFPADAGGPHHGHHFDGHRHCAIYVPAGGIFIIVADMGPEPGRGNAGGGRWYPTLCTLGDGEVYAFQGHPFGTDSRHGNDTPERYSAGSNTWAMLPQIGQIIGEPILYPRMHLLNDGHLFVTSNINGHDHNIRVDPFSGSTEDLTALPNEAYFGFDFPSVLLPLTPSDGHRARFLLCGAAQSQFMDIGNIGAGWQGVPRDEAMADRGRTHACATLLPTGDVLLTGGADPNNDQAGVMQPEIYRTPLNRETRQYQAGTGNWETLNQPATVLRNYHSTALLMPDGRVWTAGGNSAQQPGSPPTSVQKQIEIYDPPYPAGPRPTIAAAPSVVRYRGEFELRVPQAASIGSVILMRCGSSTHAYNPDQRAVYLAFRVTAADVLATTPPPNGNIAPPGPYMLFVVDREGRPCQYARFIQLNQVQDDANASFHCTAVWEPSGVPEIQVYDWRYEDFRKKYDELWPQGWRLQLLEQRALSGTVLYTAVWRQSTEGEIQVYEWHYDNFRKKYDELWPQGWRLQLLTNVVLGDEVRYTAVWRPSSSDEIQVYGWGYADYRKKYDELWPQGWRLHILNTFVVNGEVLYTAVWRPGTQDEIQVYGWRYADYRKKYDELWPNGWRLHILSNHEMDGEVLYTAVWQRIDPGGEVQVYAWSYEDYRNKYDELWPQGWRLKILNVW